MKKSAKVGKAFLDFSLNTKRMRQSIGKCLLDNLNAYKWYKNRFKCENSDLVKGNQACKSEITQTLLII